MRIIIATPSYPPDGGGVACVCKNQYDFLSKNGHEVLIITAGIVDDLNAKNIKKIEINYEGFPKYAAGDILGHNNKILKKKYFHLIESFSPDLIISHCWQSWNTDWLINSKINTKIILFSHGISVNDRSPKFWPIINLRWMLYKCINIKRYLKRIDAFCVLEDYADDNRFYDVKIARRLGIKYYTIPNGFSINLRKHKKIEELLLLYVGDYTSNKNPKEIIETFLELEMYGVKLNVCGNNRNKYYQMLEGVIKKSKSSAKNNINLLCELKRGEIEYLYAISDIFVYSSLTDCQPLVVIDSIGMGLPFVARNVGCIKYIPGGLTYDNRDQLKSMLKNIIMDEGKRRSLSSEAFKAASNKYNWQISNNKLNKMIMEVVNE